MSVISETEFETFWSIMQISYYVLIHFTANIKVDLIVAGAKNDESN